MNPIKLMVGGLLIGGLLSCDQAVDEITREEAPQAELYQVSPQEAASVLQELLSEAPVRNTRGVQAHVDNRQVEEVIDLTNLKSTRGATKLHSELAKSFYVVNLKNNQGYAFVSKDKRTFPVFSILDQGHFEMSSLEDEQLQWRIQQMLTGFHQEVDYFNEKWEKANKQFATRANSDDPTENREKTSIEALLKDGWEKFQDAPPKMKTTWRQEVKNPSVLNKEGNKIEPATRAVFEKVPADKVKRFGCTPVAFCQVMYALREYPGFKDLRYTNGERVEWEQMNPYNSTVPATQRFLGWFTANCSPSYTKAGTIVFNTDAKDFLRHLVEDFVESRYDNCIATNFDLDGYGWSESARISHEYFAHPNNTYVIMTAAYSKDWDVINQFNFHYHTFVIDGMTEFHKRQRYGTWFWKHWKTTVRHMYHINAGWGGDCNGYYLYADSRDGFEYNGTNNAINYRSKAAYFIVRPKQDHP